MAFWYSENFVVFDIHIEVNVVLKPTLQGAVVTIAVVTVIIV